MSITRTDNTHTPSYVWGYFYPNWFLLIASQSSMNITYLSKQIYKKCKRVVPVDWAHGLHGKVQQGPLLKHFNGLNFFPSFWLTRV